MRWILLLILMGSAFAQQWKELPSLPEPVTNNAVASLPAKNGRDYLLFTMLGLQEPKTYAAITRKAWVFDSKRNGWFRLPDVPGAVGRLASTAQAVNGKVYLFGGYTVDKDGKEVSLANVDVYTPGKAKPEAGTWSKAAPIPVPVDDSVSVLYADRYIILVSGWSMTDNVRDVQVFDTKKNIWSKSTPIPGTPVFGHAGGITDDGEIVYCGGAYKNSKGSTPKYVASKECWKGTITGATPLRIFWESIPAFPGAARYRIAAAGVGDVIFFAGGTDNPYNYDARGYNGVLSVPLGESFYWNSCSETWLRGPDLPLASMDHRGFGLLGGAPAVIGGIGAESKTIAKVSKLTKGDHKCRID